MVIKTKNKSTATFPLLPGKREKTPGKRKPSDVLNAVKAAKKRFSRTRLTGDPNPLEQVWGGGGSKGIQSQAKYNLQ